MIFYSIVEYLYLKDTHIKLCLNMTIIYTSIKHNQYLGKYLYK